MSVANPSRKRRWLSISLRGLLLIITLLAMGLGWYVNRVLSQRRAVAGILRQGGRICYSYNDPVSNPQAASAPLPRFAGLLGIDFVDDVTVAEFIGPQFDDADLRLLDDLPQVRWLRIYETKVTGATFERVSGRRGITALLVNHSPLQDSALTEIGKMPQLRLLHLVDTRITDTGLGELKCLPRLESLSLSDCTISAGGVAKCALPDTLSELSLENTRFGDEGMSLLKSLPQLSRLSLYGSQVSDESVSGLEQLPHLTSVMLGATNVTNDGLRRLRAARGPALFVSPDPDGKP